MAESRYGAFLNRTSKIWDNVAAQVIITEAGGVYTDFAGQTIDYSYPLEKADQNVEYIAAAPHLHGEILKLIIGIEF